MTETIREKFTREKKAEIDKLIDPNTGMVWGDLVHRVECPICEYDTGLIVFEKQGFNTTRCQLCGLLYTNPQLKKDICEGFYIDSAMARNFVPLQEEEMDLNARNKYLPLLEAINKIRPGGKMLDVGCSTGQFMGLSKVYGWDPIGLEINAQAADYGIKNRGLYISTDTLEEHAKNKDQYDMISMLGVFEHMVEPNKTLQICKDLLNPDGILTLLLPNIHSLILRVMQEKHTMISPRGHLWYFSPDTIEKILKKNGYKVVMLFSLLPCVDEIEKHLNYGGREFSFSLPEKYQLEAMILKRNMGGKLVVIARKDNDV